MKTTLGFASLLAIMGGTAAIHYTRPSAVPEATAVALDLGVMTPGVPSHGNVRIHNPTASAWEIKSVQKSCGCTSADISKMHVAPGEDVDIAVTATPSGAEGGFNQKVILSDGNPENPPFAVVTVHGSFAADDHLVSTPGSLDLGNITSRGPVIRRVYLTRRDGADLEPIVATARDPFVKITQDNTRKDFRTFEIVLDPSHLDAGMLRSEVSFKLAGKGDPSVSVPIGGRLLDDVTCQPTALIVDGSRTTYSTRLATKSGEGLTITKCTHDLGDGWSCTCEDGTISLRRGSVGIKTSGDSSRTSHAIEVSYISKGTSGTFWLPVLGPTN